MITAEGLTKSYRGARAVDGTSFTAAPGRVTALIGANGAGKSTVIRMIVGLTTPDAGRALVQGSTYASHPAPLRVAGALLDGSTPHPGRTARSHLASLAISNQIPRERVAQVLGAVELGRDASRRVQGFSLGMRKRLGLAAALLGDPAVLVLDEPGNGLDPSGLRWLHALLRRLADEGRTVLISSHHLAEISDVADQVVVMHAGRNIASGRVHDLVRTGERLDDTYLRLVHPKETS